MVKNSRGYFLIIAALVMAGCAYGEVRPIKKTDEEGIRFYRPWPYLWVTLAKTDEGAGCKLTVEYLPDMSREYIIIPHTGMGTLKVAPQLAQGWNLTAYDVTADSKITELVGHIAGLAGNLASAAMPGFKEGQPPPVLQGPGLYRFEFDTQRDGRVTGLTQVFALTSDGKEPLSCVSKK